MQTKPEARDVTPLQEQPHHEEIHKLRDQSTTFLMVGFALSLTFLMSVFMILYSLTFVVQPLEVSPNDQKGWETLSSVMLVLAGALTGLLASNGLKDKDKEEADD
jgi:heme/copper-type cytochrome/quinol oxidase subunit 3